MRINNPKSLAGFTRNTNSDEASYKLATIGQVKNAFNILDNKFQKLLAGKMGYESNKDGNDLSNGMGGLSLQCGYAWLNNEGKVDPSLLPSLAITDTHVYTQTDVENFYKADSIASSSNPNDLYKILDLFLKDDVKKNNTLFQQGDIIIISEESYKDESETHADKVKPNPRYAGSYIIQKIIDTVKSSEAAPADKTFILAKLAYHDSNVVSVNGRYPQTTNGVLNVNLKDVLATEAPSINGVTSIDAEVLRDNVYRLTSIYDNLEEKKGLRFSFIDEGGKVIPYSTKKELDDERLSRIENDTELSAMIERLTTSTSDKDLYLSGEIDTINDTIGTKADIKSYEETATIFSRVNQLRYDIDNNADVLTATRKNTNEYLDDIKTNLTSLSSQLNDKFVTLRMQTLEWAESNHKFVKFDAPKSELLYTAENVLGEPEIKVTGTDVWTYTFTPNADYASEERILAIYDKDGNEVLADIQQKPGANPDLPKVSVIKIELDHYDNKEGEASASLIGNNMEMLIFSRRKDLKLTFEKADPISVAGSMKESRTPQATE